MTNLASKVLSLAAARVAEDFPARYGEPVVLLESFVQTHRFAGTKARLRAHPRAPCIQDTTELDYTTKQGIADLGH